MQDKKWLLTPYEILMASLAFIIIGILILEFTIHPTSAQEKIFDLIDFSVLIIFAIDYFYRLYRADNKWKFIKSNIWDLIAIMPFDKVFRLARLGRLIRLRGLFRLLKLFRIAIYGRKFFVILWNILKTNGLIYIIVLTIVIVIIGALGIMAVEPGMGSFGDSLWWSAVTTTTVGYGDIAPKTLWGRILAVLLMLVGIGFLGMVTGSIATFFVERIIKPKTNQSMAVEQMEYIKSKLDNIENLHQDDVKVLNHMIQALWEVNQKCKKP